MANIIKKSNKGFTLIELLVVIAIIGVISSVVLSNLNNARNKSKDATIKEQMGQMVNLMALNFDDYGSYCNLQPAVWISASGACSASGFSGNYVAQAISVCNNVFKNASDIWAPAGAYRIRIYNPYCTNTYSFTVSLNDGNWYCVGSSGIKAEYTTYDTSQPGCASNP